MWFYKVLSLDAFYKVLCFHTSHTHLKHLNGLQAQFHALKHCTLHKLGTDVTDVRNGCAF